MIDIIAVKLFQAQNVSMLIELRLNSLKYSLLDLTS